MTFVRVAQGLLERQRAARVPGALTRRVAQRCAYRAHIALVFGTIARRHRGVDSLTHRLRGPKDTRRLFVVALPRGQPCRARSIRERARRRRPLYEWREYTQEGTS